MFEQITCIKILTFLNLLYLCSSNTKNINNHLNFYEEVLNTENPNKQTEEKLIQYEFEPYFEKILLLSTNLRQQTIPAESIDMKRLSTQTPEKKIINLINKWDFFITTQHTNQISAENNFLSITTKREPRIPSIKDKFKTIKYYVSEPSIPGYDHSIRLRTKSETEPIITTLNTDSITTSKPEPELPHESPYFGKLSTKAEPQIPSENFNTKKITTNGKTISTVKTITTTESTKPEINSIRTEPKTETTFTTLSTKTTESIKTTPSTITPKDHSQSTTIPFTIPTFSSEELCAKQLCTFGQLCDYNTNYQCICDQRNGFNGSVECQKISPCDKSFKRCGNANCIVKSDDLDKGFKCDCDVGYKRYKLDSSSTNEYICKPNKCDYPSISKCNQICINNETPDKNNKYSPEYYCKCYEGYNLSNDNKTCTTDRINCQSKNCGNRGFCVKDQCICKQRYAMIDGKCEIDQNWCNDNCSGHCIESSNEVICNCSAPKHRLNASTGLCIDINLCDKSEAGGKLCESQRAICIQDSSDKGYWCRCPEGRQLSTNENKCIDACDITSNRIKCEDMNAKCVYNSSAETKFSCNCNPGLEWSGSDQKCLMSKFAIKTTLQIRNPNLNPIKRHNSLYYEENSDNKISITEFNDHKVIIGSILSELTISLKRLNDDISGVSLINCNQMSQPLTDYKCDLSIQLSDESDNGLKDLKSKIMCDKKTGAYCFISPNTLISQNTKISLNQLDPCNDISNACKTSLHSECHRIEGSTQYECLCPQKGFRVRETLSLGKSFDERDLRFEFCEDIDECFEGKCSANHKNCLNKIGDYECYCDKGYKMNKTEDCIAVCSDVNCNHGVCKESGNNGFWCECNNGYSSGDCNIKSSSPPQTAYIITLSVLAFVFLLISVIAAFCVGKSKGKYKDDYNIQWGEWQAPRFQRTASNHPQTLPRTVSRITESEQ